MIRFITLVTFRDYLLALTEDGTLYKIRVNDIDGSFHVTKELRIEHKP